jgi:hypothetical protein
MLRASWLLGGLVAGLCTCATTLAQDLTPRAYVITPTGSNAVILTYANSEGSVTLAGGAPITDARSNVNVFAASYYRGLDFFGRSANLTITVPYGFGDFKGTVFDVPAEQRRSGSLDSSVRFSVNLLGGAAMTPAEMAKWHQSVLLGTSLTIVAPTGQYDPTRVINWGSNRWAFKPELGYSERWSHLLFDTYVGGWFFTENSEFFSHNTYFPGTNTRTQRPVGAVEAHLSYDVKPRLWISLDANYWWGGQISLNGVQNPTTEQGNSRVGVSASVPITRHQSVKASFSDGALARYGGNYKTISVAWQYSWLDAPASHR